MIPATAIHFNDDGTAWLVLDEPYGDPSDLHHVDRPCDEPGCVDGSWLDGDGDIVCDCELCDGTGRHTFTVEVECTGKLQPNDRGGLTCDGGCSDHPYGVLTHRVSVAPGMVLSIVEALFTGPPPTSAIEMVPAGAFVLRTVTNHHTWHSWQYMPITLPPDAKPGDWAVKLQVHQ